MKKLEPAPIRTPFNNGLPSSQWERWFNQLKALVDSLNDFVESLQTSTNTDISGIKEAIQAINTAIAGINTAITSLQSGLSTAQSDITLIKSDVVSIKSNISAIEKSLDDLLGDVQTIQGDIVTINNGISALQGDISTINAWIDSVFTDSKVSSQGTGKRFDFGWEDPTAYGDYERTSANIALACTAAASNGGKVRLFGGTFECSGTLDFQGVPIDVMPGCYLNIQAGCVISNLNLVSHEWQLISCAIADTPAIKNYEIEPVNFGALKDGSSDDHIPFQCCVESLREHGGEIHLDNGTYCTSTDIIIKYNNIRLIGKSMLGSTIKWIGGASGASEIIYINKNTYNSGSSYEGIHIKNLMLDGNNIAYLGLYAFGVTSDCRFEHIRITQCQGFLWAQDVWYSCWYDIHCWAHYDGMPAGGVLADWQSMHNSSYSAPIKFTQANSTTIIGLHVASFGTTNIPVGGAKSTHILYVTGYNVNIRDVSFENSNGHNTETVSFDRLISCNSGTNHKIDELYIEKVCGNYGINIGSGLLRDVKIGKTSLQNTVWKDKFIYVSKQPSLIVEGIAALNSRIDQDGATSPTIIYNAEPSETGIKNVLWESGDIVMIAGADYVEMPDYDIGPVTIRGNYSYNYTQLPTVKSGCVASKYTNGGIDYLLVTGGSINVDRWKVVPVGRYNSASAGTTGFKFRPPRETANWNVCVDFFGCVFLEKQDSARLDVSIGKLILATFTTDASGLITVGPTAVTNTLRGEQINSITNKRVYRADLPTTGIWAKGDEIFITDPSGGIFGYRCTVAGDYAGVAPVWIGYGSAVGFYGTAAPATKPAHIADAANAAGATPTQAEFNALNTVVKALTARLESFGMSATA